MINSKYISFLCIVALLITSCVKHREFDTPATTNNTLSNFSNNRDIVPGILKVNEFLAKGSTTNNEFGTASDWFEIYNTTDVEIVLEAGKWFVTDSLPNKEKFEIPLRTNAIKIVAHGFLIIWCDGLGNSVNQNDIHTSFKLNSSAGDLGIYYKKDDNAIPLLIDGISYGVQQSGISNGRKPDGAGAIMVLPVPSPGTSNN